MSFLATMETKVLTLLSPLLATNGGSLKRIEVQAFDSEDDFDELLKRFEPRMPAGFLSVPIVSVQKAGGPRVPDASLSYFFLVGNSSSRSEEARRQALYAIFDLFFQQMALQQVGRQSLPTTAPPDFIQLGVANYRDDEKMAAMLISFQIVVRNIQLNTPA